MTGSFPVRTAQSTCDIEGQPTQFLLSAYADRVMVVVTQLESLGAVLHAQKESVLGGGSTYRVDMLLGGREDPALELCARQLAERLSEDGCERPLLLCLGLRRQRGGGGGASVAAVRSVVAHVMGLDPVWK